MNGSAAGAPTGSVTFIVTADKPHGKLVCQGGNTQALSATSGTPPQMAATCSPPSGWPKLKKATKKNPNPENQWTVVATYGGDKSYAGGSYGINNRHRHVVTILPTSAGEGALGHGRGLLHVQGPSGIRRW